MAHGRDAPLAAVPLGRSAQNRPCCEPRLRSNVSAAMECAPLDQGNGLGEVRDSPATPPPTAFAPIARAPSPHETHSRSMTHVSVDFCFSFSTHTNTHTPLCYYWACSQHDWCVCVCARPKRKHFLFRAFSHPRYVGRAFPLSLPSLTRSLSHSLSLSQKLARTAAAALIILRNTQNSVDFHGFICNDCPALALSHTYTLSLSQRLFVSLSRLLAHCFIFAI